MENQPNPITLITGTSRGIGEFLAQHYLRLGHDVIGCSRTSAPDRGEHYRHFTLDVSNEDYVKPLFSEIMKTYGRLDNVINNAGTASMNHSLLTPIETVRRIYSVNVMGTFLFCREAAKLMMKKKYGRIVNFSSVAVPLKLEGEAAYASSKAAVLSLTEVLAREYADYGITVNCVAPCPVSTALIANVPQNKIEDLVKRQAIKQYGTFEDIANIIDFFLSKSSRIVTGQCLFLGGV